VALGLAAAGCGAGTASHLSVATAPAPGAAPMPAHGVAPIPSPTVAAPPTGTAIGGTATVGTAIAGTATVGPASTVVAVPGGGGPPSTALPPPTLPAPTLPPPAPPGTGAYGYVTAGPTCPVERPGQPCPPRALVVTVQAEDRSGRAVAAASSDGSGRYRLALPPGSYTLIAETGSALPRCPPVPVTVGSGAPTRTDISCDTGIR
jgi:hypothetical protein